MEVGKMTGGNGKSGISCGGALKKKSHRTVLKEGEKPKKPMCMLEKKEKQSRQLMKDGWKSGKRTTF